MFKVVVFITICDENTNKIIPDKKQINFRE